MAEQVKLLDRGLRGARNVDDVVSATFAALAEDSGVSRAALALKVAGGRQLRFVSSDRLGGDAAPEWCLIDAYDHLPLNDAVRSGRDVVLADRRSLETAYPALAARQGPTVRSMVALALVDGERTVGGLLLYLHHEVSPSGIGEAGEDLKSRVVRALRTVRDVSSLEDTLPAGHRLPADETAPALARQLLRGALHRLGVAEDGLDSALLCASEIVTNVIMHTARPSVLNIDASGEEVTVQIRHPRAGAQLPTEVPNQVDPLEIAGRGLALVDAVADAWGVEQEPDHTCWWFRIG